MEWRLAVGLRALRDGTKRRAQFQIVVDFRIGDQGTTAGLIYRLISRFKIDNGQARLYHSDSTGEVFAFAIGASVAECTGEGFQDRCVWTFSIGDHYAGDAAHQAVILSKKFM